MDHYTAKPDDFNGLFFVFNLQVKQIEISQRSNTYIASFNTIINTNHSEEYLGNHGSSRMAIYLVPVVTELDKILWCGVYNFYMQKRLNLEKTEYDPSTIMFTWIYLLLLVQEKELETGRTINTDSIEPQVSALKVIMERFEETESKKYTRKMTSNELSAISTLFEQRKALEERIREERKQDKAIRIKTQKGWELFLKLINDLSETEKSTIGIITSNTSAKEKIKAIKNYNKKLSDIECCKYILDKRVINLYDIFIPVANRIEAGCSSVTTMGGYPFDLSPAIFDLATLPHTYNTVFIEFHMFRLEPNISNAEEFIKIALECINKNLAPEKKIPGKNKTLEIMIFDFYSTVTEFTELNREYIDKLCFDRLQPNAAIINPQLYSAQTESDSFCDMLKSKCQELAQEGELEEKIIKLYENKMDKKCLDTQIDQFENELEGAKSIIEARKIILSINILYLFCDALRMILSSEMVHELSNKTEVTRIRKQLQKIETQLVNKVYNISENEPDILEFREKTGVVYTSLSEHEAQMEKLRNEEFSAILKSAIEKLASNIEAQDTDGILQTKAEIKEEISCYPDCDNKYYYAEWLDSISIRISDALISICKKADDNYLEVKSRITSSLGEKSCILPSSSIDSLTTAEMLYQRYAKDKYANKGFDYSCISALYFQAFEDAYNELIWTKYAAHLNSLSISGVNYTTILMRHNSYKLNNRPNASIIETDARGYLFDDDLTQRRYYYSVRSSTATVNARCMYKSFAIIMSQLKTTTDLTGFCDFIAHLCGFAGITEMFNDAAFMQKCHDFSVKIDTSADNRNNASHGGSFINLTQCMDDKKTVLNNLERIKKESVGLIQQLLYILQKD